MDDNQPCKVLMLGAASTGKTSLTRRIVYNKFDEDAKPTLGAGILTTTLCDVKLNIWDTAGQENYRSLARVYYRDAQCAIIVFDISKPSTFDEISYWVSEIQQSYQSFQEYCSLFLVGNKIDLFEDGCIMNDTTATARKFAEVNEIMYFETSAKTGYGVRELFENVAQRAIEVRNDPTQFKRYIGKDLKNIDELDGNKNSCC